MKKILVIFAILLLTGFCIPAKAQLTVSTAMTPAQLVQNVLVGTGVTVSNVTYTGLTGASSSIGEFTTGPNPTNLGLSHGIIMSTGLVNGTPTIGSPVTNFSSNSNGTGSDPTLAGLVPGYTVYDAAVLQFDFIPLSDTIKFRYVFGSEEYPEWVGSTFNDVFGFFITGPNPLGGNYTSKNIALIPGTALPVTINNVNSGSYAIYFVDNQGLNGQTIVYDGFTTVLTAWCIVVPCVQYHIKIAIGDCGDSAYDSAVFLDANSFSTNAVTVQTFYTVPLAGTNAVEGCSDAIISFQLPNPLSTPFTIPFVIGGTATNGIDYTTIPNSVTIPAGQDSVNLTIHPFQDGIPEPTETVTLIVQTSICGGSDTITINILNNNPMSLGTSPDTTICGGQATIWAHPAGGIQPYTYTWSNGAGNVSSQTVAPTATTTYSVTVSDICGTTLTGDITIFWGQGTADAGNDVTLCAGQSTTLAAIGGTNGYLWSNGVTTALNTVTPATTTTYYVTAYGACNAYDSVTVFVNPLPNITASASSPVIFQGDNDTLTATGGATYQWSSNPYDVSLISQINSPGPVVSPQTTTTYSVVGVDSNGCSGAASVTVTVIQILPEIYFSADPVSGCEPLVVQFTDSSQKVNPGAIYRWNFGNGTTSNLINPQAYYPDHGVYDVSLTITNPNGLTSTLTKYGMITVYPKPITYFEILPGRMVSMFESNLGFFDETIGYVVKWSWNFGDGDTSDQKDVYHEYQDTGTYHVSLITTTEFGCTDTATNTVVIRPDYFLFVPNAFTPNGDGKNDKFIVRARGIIEDSYEIRIFTRWGQEFYYSKDIYDGWDGKYKDKGVPTDTYVYDIRFKDIMNKFHRVNGTITLYR